MNITKWSQQVALIFMNMSNNDNKQKRNDRVNNKKQEGLEIQKEECWKGKHEMPIRIKDDKSMLYTCMKHHKSTILYNQ